MKMFFVKIWRHRSPAGGNPVGQESTHALFSHPEVQAFWPALTEDYVRSYPIDGVMWGSERQGPFGNAIGAVHGGTATNPFEVACFCDYCRQEAKSRGIDVQRAIEGYERLAALVRNGRAAARPSDGYFVSYWRLLVQYPEILAWEKLWNDGQKSATETSTVSPNRFAATSPSAGISGITIPSARFTALSRTMPSFASILIS